MSVCLDAFELAEEVALRASNHVNFFAVDVAERASGGWTLIEINDGQMAGLSCIEPFGFYKSLSESITRQGKTLIALSP